MSSTSPSDLDVTFRSVPRRLAEARGDAPPELVADLTGELDRELAAAAALLGSQAAPLAIADAIAARHAADWDESTLTSLRSIALDVGRLLRAVAARAEADD